MKKTLMATVLVSLLLCCTGCGKKLTCTGKFMGMDAKIVTKFSDDKAKTSTMEFEMDVKEYLDLDEDPSEEDMKEAVEEIKEEFEEMDGYENVKVTSKGNVITVKCSYTFDEDEQYSYDDTKKQYEEMDLTCK